MTLAVQVTDDGPWHAAYGKDSRITLCSKRRPPDGWTEYKDARFVVNEKWCQKYPCVKAFNKAIE